MIERNKPTGASARDPRGGASGSSRRELLLGAMGATPGTFYDFNMVRQNTPNPSFLNTLEPH